MILNTVYLGVYFLRDLNPDPAQSHGAQLYNPVDQFARDFSAGVFDTRHIVFYGALTLFFLFGTYKLFEGRRWS